MAAVALDPKILNDFAEIIVEPTFRIVDALQHLPKGPAFSKTAVYEAAIALVNVFEARGQGLPLALYCLKHEIHHATSSRQVLRDSAPLSRGIIADYVKVSGTAFVKGVVASIRDSVAVGSYEIDPQMMAAGEKQETNLMALKQKCTEALDVIIASGSSIPPCYHILFHRFHKDLTTKFPQEHLDGAVALAFFSTSFGLGLLDREGLVEDSNQHRALVLISKTLQRIAEGREFDGRDEDLELLNPLVMEQAERAAPFFRSVVTLPEGVKEDDHITPVSIPPEDVTRGLMLLLRVLSDNQAAFETAYPAHGSPVVAPASPTTNPFTAHAREVEASSLNSNPFTVHAREVEASNLEKIRSILLAYRQHVASSKAGEGDPASPEHARRADDHNVVPCCVM